MQPVDINRDYFLSFHLRPETHQKWKDAIATFEKAASAANESLKKYERKEIDLAYNKTTHTFDEIPGQWSQRSIKDLCSEWRQDHLSILAKSCDLASKDSIVDFLQGKAARSRDHSWPIPNSLSRFLKKIRENKVKAPEEKAQNKNEKKKCSMISSWEKAHLSEIDLLKAREEALVIKVPADLQPVKDAFCAGLLAMDNYKTQNAATYKFVHDPECKAERFIRFLTAIAGQTKEAGQLRKFFNAYFYLVRNLQRLENKAIAPELNLAEALSCAKEGKILQPHNNPAPTPTPPSPQKPPTPPTPSPKGFFEQGGRISPTSLKPPSCPPTSEITYNDKIIELEALWIYKGNNLSEAYKEALKLRVPDDLQAIKDAFCAHLKAISAQGKPAHDVASSAFYKLFNDPNCASERLVPFLNAITQQVKLGNPLSTFLNNYAQAISDLIRVEQSYLESQKGTPTKPKATKEFADALLATSEGQVTAVQPQPQPSSPITVAPPAVTPPPPAAPSPSVEQPPAPAPVPAPSVTPPVAPPASEGVSDQPVGPVVVAAPLPASEPVPQPNPQPNPPAQEESIWSSFCSWFGGLFVSFWRWLNNLFKD